MIKTKSSMCILTESERINFTGSNTVKTSSGVPARIPAQGFERAVNRSFIKEMEVLLLY